VVPEFADCKALILEDDSLGLQWTLPGFDDSGWLEGTTAVGYERSGTELVIRHLNKSC
jgi:hypothetical protein